jgi:hypothetical protein
VHGAEVIDNSDIVDIADITDVLDIADITSRYCERILWILQISDIGDLAVQTGRRVYSRLQNIINSA